MDAARSFKYLKRLHSCCHWQCGCSIAANTLLMAVWLQYSCKYAAHGKCTSSWQRGCSYSCKCAAHGSVVAAIASNSLNKETGRNFPPNSSLLFIRFMQKLLKQRYNMLEHVINRIYHRTLVNSVKQYICLFTHKKLVCCTHSFLTRKPTHIIV